MGFSRHIGRRIRFFFGRGIFNRRTSREKVKYRGSGSSWRSFGELRFFGGQIAVVFFTAVENISRRFYKYFAVLVAVFPDIFGNLIHMDIGGYAEHRHIPVKCINKRFHYIASPLFSHTSVLGKYLYWLEYCNALIYFGFIMSHIKSVADTLFICIKKRLSFLFEVGNVLIKQWAKLKTVHHYFKTVTFNDIPESLFGIVKGQSVLFLIVKLRTAERTFYYQTCPCIRFPFTSARFTLHQISPSFREFHNSMKVLSSS